VSHGSRHRSASAGRRHKIAYAAVDWSLEERWGKQDELVFPVFGSEDAQEGAKAFAEKRAPVWKGK
jgi:enoyl-CoA hydratase